MKVMFTGGGTAGHVTPNIAVIEELRKSSGEKTGNAGGAKNKKFLEIFYLGSKDGMEKKMMEKTGINYTGISCGKLRRYFSLLNFRDFFRVIKGFFEAKKALKKIKPNLIFSKGGYVGLPVTVAGKFLKIPVILHESDVIPGLANRIAMRFADKICLSFTETKKMIPEKYREKILVTGNPVREWILKGNKEVAYKFTGLNKHRPVVLVMGGSLGAAQINQLVRDSLKELLKRYQIVHITGRGNLDIGIHQNGYMQYEFLNEKMKDIYAICEMIVSRAGANSLFEIALLKKKALIIPLGTEVSRGDQIENAKIFGKEDNFKVLKGNIEAKKFVEAWEELFKKSLKTSRKFKNGAKEIANLILNFKR